MQIDILKKAFTVVDQSGKLFPQSDCFVFQDGYVHTTNGLNIFKAKIDITENFSVNAEAFLCVIAEDSTYSIDGDIITIKRGRSKTSLAVYFNTYATLVQLLPSDPLWKRVPDGFVTCVEHTMISGNKTSISGIYINGNILTSSNAYIISQAVMEAGQFDPMWIDEKPTKAIRLCKPTEYFMDATWVHFRDKDIMLSCRLRDANEYPINQIESYCTNAKNLKEYESNEDKINTLIDSFTRASLFTTDDGNAELNIGDYLTVSANNARGTYSDTLGEFALNPGIFTIPLKAITDKIHKGNSIGIYVEKPGMESFVIRESNKLYTIYTTMGIERYSTKE